MFEDVFIVIPAFNEEERIAPVVRSLRDVGFKNIVVVDDGSKDQTAERALSAGANVFRHAINRGQGAALQTGNAYAQRQSAKIVVHFDGDGQFNPDDIVPAIEVLSRGKYDIVFGSRFLDARSESMPWIKKKLLLPIGRVLNRLMTGVTLSDAHNGFRVLGAKALNKIAISHDGMAHNSDIVAQVKQHELRFCEHPVEVRYFEFGQGVRGGFTIVRDWCLGWFLS